MLIEIGPNNLESTHFWSIINCVILRTEHMTNYLKRYKSNILLFYDVSFESINFKSISFEEYKQKWRIAYVSNYFMNTL